MKMLRSNGVHQSAGFGIQSRVLRKVRRRQAARRKGSRQLFLETLEQRALLTASWRVTRTGYLVLAVSFLRKRLPKVDVKQVE